MHGRARVARITVAVVGFASVLAVQPAAGAGTATRYASPNGTGTACTAAAPCDIVTAVNDATGGSVLLEPGSYWSSPGEPLATSLVDNGNQLVIHGVPGKPLPLVHSSAGNDAFNFTGNSTLSRAAVDYSGFAAAIGGVGSADHVRAFATSQNAQACHLLGDLRDSLCVATADDGTALELDAQTTGNAHVTGVTAVAPAQGGVALLQTTPSNTAFTVYATNDILRGSGFDVYQYDPPTAAETVFLSHSDSATTGTGGGGAASVLDDGGNTSVAPAFVDPAHGNYREAANSVTIDAGDSTSVNAGETDLAGLPRSVGAAPDMGAYEFARKPSVGKLMVTGRGAHALHLAVRCNPGGLATKLTVSATHWPRTVRKIVTIDPSTTTRTVHITVRRLRARTTYRVRALASNAVGHTRSPIRRARTT